jgi:hypothetical protein
MSREAAMSAFATIQKMSHSKLKDQADEDESGKNFLLKYDAMLDAYASPKGYMEWNDYAKLCLASGSTRGIMASFKEGDVYGAIAGTSYRSAIVQNACARYISKEIVESFAQTALPELPLEITSILPCVHLMLPRNMVFDAEGDEVIALLVQSGQLYAKEMAKDKEEIAKTFFPKEKLAPLEVMGAEGIQVITLTKAGLDVFQEFVSPNAKSWWDSNVKYVDSSKYMAPGTERIMRIAINSLLVHLYEPELVTTDPKPVTKGVGFSGRSKAPLPPTWIGRTFRNSGERHHSKAEDSTRGGVRSHWRRGHWHSVCVGPKRSERRVQWFKPVYVNPG